MASREIAEEANRRIRSGQSVNLPKFGDRTPLPDGAGNLSQQSMRSREAAANPGGMTVGPGGKFMLGQEEKAGASIDAAQKAAAPAADPSDFTSQPTAAQQAQGMNWVPAAVAVGTVIAGVATGVMQQRAASRERARARKQFDEEVKQREIDRQVAENARRENMTQGAIGNIGNRAMEGAAAQGSALSKLAGLFGGGI